MSDDRATVTREQSGKLAEAHRLLREKDLESAERALAIVTAENAAPVAAYRLHVRVLQRLGRSNDAFGVLRKGFAAWPRDGELEAAFVDILYRTYSPEEAHKELLKAVGDDADNAFLQSAAANSWLALGNSRRALQRITRAARLDRADKGIALRQVVILAVSRAREEAIRAAAEGGWPDSEILAAFEQTVTFLSRLNRTQRVIAVSEAAFGLVPGNAAPLVWSAEALLHESRASDALACLDRWVEPTEAIASDLAFRYLCARGQALHDLGRHDDAFGAYDRALLLKPEDETLLRKLYVLAQRASNEDRRKIYGKSLTRAGSKTLPSTLAEGLAALRERKITASMSPRARWAWELADKTQWTENEWLTAVAWGQAADRLLRSWWLNAQDRCDEIDALIDRPTDTVIDALPAAAKCVCVTTHMGPLAASVRYIQTVGRNFRGFGVAGPDPVVGDAPPMRIAQSAGASALRKVIEEIGKGTLIGFAAEVPAVNEGLALDFLGRKITLSTMVPRLMASQGAACIWWQGLWRGDRIVIEIERLPDPEPNEPIELWCRRWADAYLARVGRVMKGPPQNLTLRGIWGNAE